MSEIRVRFAPSPTGRVHIGAIRTALFNYFFAKSNNGKFFIRIEDTDRSRYDPKTEKEIYEVFKWLGIHIDEGVNNNGYYAPYIQSERLEIYKKELQYLIDNDMVYPCFCNNKDNKDGYQRCCRNITKEEANEMIKHKPHTWRLKLPLSGSVVINDILLGDITFKNDAIPVDPILMKQDGYPTYHFAHVVDDHHMKTSHVLRGQEWLPSTPIHVHLFNMFGWTVPEYCHLSTIVGEDGKKLSKRHGATGILEFKKEGYLKEALINYVTLLGWSYDDKKTIFNKTDFEQLFDLSKLSKSNAQFDYDKLNHLNGYYIRQKTDSELIDLLIPEYLPTGSEKMIPIIKERLVKLSDAKLLLNFMFDEPVYTDKEIFIQKNKTIDYTLDILNKINNTPDNILLNFDYVKEYCKNNDIIFKEYLSILRVAFTGSKISPPLFELFDICGTSLIKERIENAIKYLSLSLSLSSSI